MKSLKNLLGNIIPATTISLGIALVGIGIYNLEKKNIEKGNLIFSFGAMIATFGCGFYFGKEYEKNYQTKPEDYQIK